MFLVSSPSLVFFSFFYLHTNIRSLSFAGAGQDIERIETKYSVLFRILIYWWGMLFCNCSCCCYVSVFLRTLLCLNSFSLSSPGRIKFYSISLFLNLLFTQDKIHKNHSKFVTKVFFHLKHKKFVSQNTNLVFKYFIFFLLFSLSKCFFGIEFLLLFSFSSRKINSKRSTERSKRIENSNTNEGILRLLVCCALSASLNFP